MKRFTVNVVERSNPMLHASFTVQARDERAAIRSACARAQRAIERACGRLGPHRRYSFSAASCVLVGGAP